MSSNRWYFTKDDDGTIELRARFEGPGGMIGDARNVLHPGEPALNVTYAELFAAGAGVLVISRNGKKARIETR